MSIWLVMQKTDGSERSFAVKKPHTVIGRENNCDVRIPMPTVSQKHCRITLDGADLLLTDLDSDQGTYHNGNRIKEVRLNPHDTLTIGPVTFVVRVNADALLDGEAEPEITIIRQEISGSPNRLNFDA
jgi:pSer/pThr/pTyr-binding forkhead associated (FHA) protein